jgi:hypothetical protein
MFHVEHASPFHGTTDYLACFLGPKALCFSAKSKIPHYFLVLLIFAFYGENASGQPVDKHQKSDLVGQTPLSGDGFDVGWLVLPVNRVAVRLGRSRLRIAFTSLVIEAGRRLPAFRLYVVCH